MSKKTFGNLILIGLAVTLGFTLLDLRSDKRTFEEEIGFFILENLEDDVQYTGKGFREVNEAFLASQTDIQQAMLVVRDSISNQLEIIKGNYLSSALNHLVQNAEFQLEGLELASVSDYLTLDAGLKRQLKKESILDKNAQALLYQEEARMHQAISDLNTSLGQYNLSVFGLNLSQSSTIIYLHDFQLDDPENGLFQKRGVFELDRESREVVSFREI